LIDERQHPIAAGPSIVLSERALGVPLYPGASLQPGWSTKVSKASGLEVEAKYSTSDPASRVAAFYKRNLGSALKVILEADETTMYLGSGRNIVTMAERSTHGQTQINILHKDAKFPMAEVNEKVRQIVAQQLQVNEVEVTPNARFQEDLGADSLDLIEMVMQVEEAFDIQIADGAAEKIMTVKDAVDYIDLKWNAAKS
jgi:acyl carrier protein